MTLFRRAVSSTQRGRTRLRRWVWKPTPAVHTIDLSGPGRRRLFFRAIAFCTDWLTLFVFIALVCSAIDRSRVGQVAFGAVLYLTFLTSMIFHAAGAGNLTTLATRPANYKRMT
ncbi:MAG: hypothetical protein M3Y42_18185 [Actinomycetota bacterium]|nr:hypothetical protein [Actinomycetota bacterium]MDQ2958872.1 hypothetical protein [Actinomycetota bacterium]